MAIVTFDYSAFIAAYPTFNLVSQSILQRCFDQSCLILNNTDSSVVKDVTERTTLLWLLVAHIATLMGQTNTNIAAGTQGAVSNAGRLSSASEGSVSISYDFPAFTMSQAYFVQTQYGFTYWQLILPYRSFRYRPRNVVIM